MARNQPKIEKIICCDKCSRPLWSLKILSYYKDRVGATEWTSFHPDVFKGEPKNFECPLCLREFVHTHKSGRKALMLADPVTGGRKLDWMTGPGETQSG